MKKKELAKWKKDIRDAIIFARNYTWFMGVDYKAGKMDEDLLSRDGLTEYYRLREILGDHAIAYLASKEVDSIPPASGERAKEQERRIREEYKRIKSLTLEQFHEEVEKEVQLWNALKE